MLIKDIHISKGNRKDEEKLHAKIAQQCKLGIVEIGVLKGKTSSILSRNAPSQVNVYGIDPIIPDSMNHSLIGSIAEIKRNTLGLNNFTFIHDYSYNAVLSFFKPIDYLFIDGDHRYESVKKDFEDWYPKVHQGGFISIHDSAANRKGPHHWEGPSRLADELIFDNRLEYIETVFCLTLFRKL